MNHYIFETERNLLFHESKEGGKQMVTLKKCFPWTEGASFFSVRNTKDEEVAFIGKMSELDKKDYQAIAKYFKSTQTQFKIKKVKSVEEEYDLRLFEVETQFGIRNFQMKADDWPIVLSKGKILLFDLSGDFYVIDDLNDLTAKEQKIINYLVD